MRRRDTMRLRSSWVFPATLVLIFLTLNGIGQNPAPGQKPVPGDAFPPQIAEPRPGPAKPADPPQASDPAQDKPQESQGQQPSAQEEPGGFVFHKKVEEVVLHATVVDEKQRMVMNLEKGAFTVLEDGKPQIITSFRHEDIPVALGIVIDNSGSMREKRERVNKAALNLVRASNHQDQDFTSDIKKLQEALEKVEARGGTALYDALVASWDDYLKKNAKLQKKVMLVVTDGEDNESRETLEDTVRRLSQENGPTIYAIGLLGEERERRA